MAGGPPYRLDRHFIHLGLGATSVPQPAFGGGMDWYEGYGARHGGDGSEGRLVSEHAFTESWDAWEMHPHGSEIVICIEGRMDLRQEFPDGREECVRLEAGEYAINPPGVWHIADIDAPSRAIFITAGEGTEHRPR